MKIEKEKAEIEVRKFYTFLIALLMFNFFLILTLFFLGAIYYKIIPIEFIIFYFLIVIFSLIFLPKLIYNYFYKKEKKLKEKVISQ